MSVRQCCSLCCTPCDDYNLLKNESGETNKFYEITVKYFDPMLLTDEANLNLHHMQVLCQDCWYHINEFHEFQQTVLRTRMLWEHKDQIETSPIEIKPEDCENVDTNTHYNKSFDVSNDEDDRLDYFESQRLKTESMTMLEDTTESIDNQANGKEKEPKKSKLSQEIDKTKDKNELQYKTRRDRMLKGVTDAFIAEWKPELLCGICSETYNNFNKLRSHFKEKHKTSFYIKCCEKKFVHRYRLVNHIQLHLNPETHKCDICGKPCSTKQSLKQHMKEMHEDTKKLKCDICERLFKRKTILKRHLLTHATGSKDFICSECGKGYVDEQLLRFHIKRAHDPRVCDQCGRTIHGFHALKKHLMHHAGIERPKFPCDVCGIKLSTRTLLKRHQASYHNDCTTIYICGVCGKVTASEHALAKHKRVVHVEKRKHKCTYCEKAFKSPKSLREHIATHTGQDLYQCPHCPQTFKGSSNMYNHRKKVHPVEYKEAQKNRLHHPKINSNQVKKLVVL